MTTPPLVLLLVNYLLIGCVSLVALTIMIYWNKVTGGSWRRLGGWRFHASGKSLMGLLGIVFFITFNAAIQGLFIAPLVVKATFYFMLYIAFIVSLIKIGLTIRNEAVKSRGDHVRNGKIDITNQGQDGI